MIAFPPLAPGVIPDVLELPIVGRDGVTRTYRISDPPAEDGLSVDQLVQRAARMSMAGQDDAMLLDDDEEQALYRRVLGEAYGPLVAEAAPEEVRRAALAVLCWLSSGHEAALRFWRGKARV
ncbi:MULTISPECIES: DUF7426 family protein [Streptomyces rochei group]|uniref:DUF7426 family protein n=1 Tax=Streptomyces rochei group TaxID=2867164 RepID=UPI001874D842|nr:hypothetical protein [Streptomyces vinaceusdrappus]GHC26962.1 hypothetical protein GCM10010308_49820 [Streptomyces vinaceusdrappus]